MPIGRATVLLWLIAGLLMIPSAEVCAKDLIAVSVDGVPRASGSSFIDLVDDALSQVGAFQNLSGLASYTLSFDYLGIPGAIVFDAASNGAQITVAVPSIGFSRVFTGANPNDVEQQIENFFKDEGLSAYASFQEEVNARSKVAVLDGNPRSTTALLARSAFDRFGLGAARTRAGYRRSLVARWRHLDLQAELSGGVIEADGFDGLGVVDGALTLAGDFEAGIGISFSLLGQYRDYDGAGAYDVGVEFGVPVRFHSPNAGVPIRWVLTPFLQAGLGVSLDLAAGGLMLGGGAVNSVSYNLGEFEFMIANELAYYGGLPVDEVGGYSLETNLDQLIMRNGGKVAYHFSDSSFVEGGLSVTNFLTSGAAVEVYATPFAGMSMKFGFVALRVGWESDLGDDYEAHIGKAEIAISF